MFARHVSMQLKPNTRAEFTETIENVILPILRKQHGFQDEIAFVAPGSGTEVVAISLWDKKEDAETYSHTGYAEVQRLLARVIEGTPQVQTHEVGTSTFHKASAHAV